MGAMKDREVSSLTLESQRTVELARALAARPRLLLLVEHDLDLVAQVSQRIFVLSSGRLVFDGGPEDFRVSPVVYSLLVGL